MLGGEQSGHIEAIGFEMYTSMLEAAVKEMKGEGSDERPATQLNLGIALRIDEIRRPAPSRLSRAYYRLQAGYSHPTYGGRPALGMHRQALHAARLAFAHPSSGRTVSFEAPPPADFAAALEAMMGTSATR